MKRGNVLKIAVVTGEADRTIYLYDEREDWTCSAQIAIRLPNWAPGETLSDDARQRLREFLDQFSTILSEPGSNLAEEVAGE